MEKNFDSIFLDALGKDEVLPQKENNLFDTPQEPAKPQATNQLQKAEKTTNHQVKETSKNNPLEIVIMDDVLDILESQKQDGLVNFEDYNYKAELLLAIRDIISKGYTNCNRDSIVGSLVEYAIQGLSISQKQAWFVKFGDNLTLLRSYFGDVAVCKRTNLIKNCDARVIYENDEFSEDYDEEHNIIITHHTKFGNQDGKILGAYAWADTLDGKRIYCVMTMKEIKENWNLSKAAYNKKTGEKQDIPFQVNFPQEASKRTVIRRLVKNILNTSVKTNEYQKSIIASFNRSMEKEYIDADYESEGLAEVSEKVHKLSEENKPVEDDLR